MEQVISVSCPCLLIGAPSSGSGKTTVTAALARWHSRRGRKVKVFKAGPDYIDPMILQQACGSEVYSLDLGMMSQQHCQQLLFNAATDADLILIEGVMGLYDGHYSAAMLAKTFGIAVALVIDARAMAETFGALAFGLAKADPELKVVGALANRIASDRHGEMAAEGLSRYAEETLSWLGAVRFDAKLSFPERHLGLVQAQEISQLQQRLDMAADLLEGLPVTQMLPETLFTAPSVPATAGAVKGLQGKTIAVAKDAAFSFVYAANLDFLREQGAELVFTSPLADTELPQCDIVYLPGGYPELHACALAANLSYLNSVRQFAGRILAECGGMIYLAETVTDLEEQAYTLAKLLPIQIHMQNKLQAIGWQKLMTSEGELMAHTFHYSSADVGNIEPTWVAEGRRAGTGEGVYVRENLIASYLHWYFPSNPQAALGLLLGSLTH